VTAWLASQGASLLLGFLASVIKSALDSYQQAQAQKAAAQAEIINATNQAAAETADAINQAAANHPADGDVAGRLSGRSF
jgi:hypothetical protein